MQALLDRDAARRSRPGAEEYDARAAEAGRRLAETYAARVRAEAALNGAGWVVRSRLPFWYRARRATACLGAWRVAVARHAAAVEACSRIETINCPR